MEWNNNMFLSDRAIKEEKEDALNRAGFSKKLGEQILNLGDNDSKVIAIYGDWGKGKTSILNIATSHIENITKKWEKAKRPVIFKFNPWNYSNQESLLFAFLQQLFSAVNARLPTTKKNFQREINNLAKALGAFEKLPLAGVPLIATSKAIDLIVPEETLESLRKKIDNFFIDLDFKVIVIIDDIDRLTTKEIRQIFQLIKINADFPNTVYLTAFDRNVVEKALDNRHYHTLDCEGEKRGVSFRICITRHRKEPLHEPLCQIFPERKTVSCLDGIHPGRIPGAVARLSQLLSEADGVLHAEREAARETMLRGILQQSFADDGRQACVYPDVSAQSDYPGYFWRSFQHASTGRQ